MPSTRPLLRPVLAALLTVMMVLGPALLSAATAPASAAPAAPSPASPQVPAAPDDSPVSLRLTRLDPTSLDQDGTLTARVEVTNTSAAPIDGAALELRARSSRVTDRAQLSQWESLTGPDTAGDPIATSDTTTITPGGTATLQVRVPAADLGFSSEAYLWGTRRVSLTLTTSDGPQDAVRSFVVWRPDGAEGEISESVLLPLTGQDPAAAATDPEGYQASAESGHLASLRTLAERPEVDWWLDPQLLDPPQVATSSEEETTNGEAAAEYAAPKAATDLATALTEGVGSRTVVSMPYARADLAGLHEDGATSLASDVTDREDAVWKDSGILRRGTAIEIPGAEASPEAFEAAAAAGADTVVVPSTSVLTAQDTSVTPSSIGTYSSSEAPGGSLTVLAPDPELSAEFSSLDGSSDTAAVTQRMLAETATIASEYAQAPRHLLISPDPEASLDAKAATQALDALGKAPWINRSSTDALFGAAEQGAMTTDPSSTGGDLYSLGRIDDEDVSASVAGDDGVWVRRDAGDQATPAILGAGVARRLQERWQQLDTLAAVMEDDAALDGPRLELVSATSTQWRDDPDGAAARADLAETAVSDLAGSFSVVPASGYNLISDAAGVPITVTNSLDTPITVRIAVSSDRPIVHVKKQPVVTVPARGQVETTVPVEAIANGTVNLSVHLASEEGEALTGTSEVPLTVNPAWENWTTMVLVIAMGVLVVVGVARARRTGSSHRAPGVHGPEDPVLLARTGRSRPVPAPTEDLPVTDDGDPDPTDPPQKEERP